MVIEPNVPTVANQPVALPLLEEESFYNVPQSTASGLIMDVLGAGGNVGDLPARKDQISHSTKYEVLEDGKRRQVSLSNVKSSVTVELADIDKTTGSNKSAKKLFIFSLIKVNEQALHGGKLTRDYISFPLQELIDIGFYKTPQSARKGFNTGVDTLTSLKIKGHLSQSKKKGNSIDALGALFPWAIIQGGQCTIYLNSHIDWGFLAQYFTILPRYYFRLSNRASDLLYYIFYLARQHTRGIEEKGYFTISFRAIRHRLQLPSEKGNNNPDRTIRQPIEDALEQIEEAHSNYYGNMEFSLLPVYDEGWTITQYLENGYLQVSLSGGFASPFKEISMDTAKRIEAGRKRKDRIAEKAAVINLAKKMEAEEKKPEGQAEPAPKG